MGLSWALKGMLSTIAHQFTKFSYLVCSIPYLLSSKPIYVQPALGRDAEKKLPIVVLLIPRRTRVLFLWLVDRLGNGPKPLPSLHQPQRRLLLLLSLSQRRRKDAHPPPPKRIQRSENSTLTLLTTRRISQRRPPKPPSRKNPPRRGSLQANGRKQSSLRRPKIA